MSSCFVFVQLLMRGGVVDHLDFIGVDLVYFCETPGFITLPCLFCRGLTLLPGVWFLACKAMVLIEQASLPWGHGGGRQLIVFVSQGLAC